MKKPPVHVYLVGQKYVITVATKDALLIDGGAIEHTIGQESLGTCSPDKGEIVVRSAPDDVSPDCQRETVLHEVLHGLLAVSALDEEPWLNDTRAESLVNRLAPVLYETLRSNPRLTQYLMDGERSTL